MTSSAAPGLRKSIRRPLVVVAGNPNTGKTTIFNRLTGSDQKVANYPGVTVERHTATIAVAGFDGRILARSTDEVYLHIFRNRCIRIMFR